MDLELVQKQPEIDAPDAGFDNGEPVWTKHPAVNEIIVRVIVIT